MSIFDTNETESQIGGERAKSLPNILVVIPAYNEEVTIGSTVIAARRITHNVVVIDDGSTDSTASVARDAGATVISHETNRGKGVAIQTAFSFFQSERHDAMILMDGDGQHEPRDIPAVAEPVLQRGSDLVIGSRYLDRKGTETPLYRRFGQKILDFGTAGSSGTTVSDSQSGFRALSATAIEKLSINTNGYGVESEMISEAAAANLDITEVPIDVKYDTIDRQTDNPLFHGFAVFAFLLRLIRDRHPLMFFGGPGVLMLVLGSAVAAHTTTLYQTTGAFHQWRVAFAGFAIIVGTVCLFSGLVLSQVVDMIEDLE